MSSIKKNFIFNTTYQILLLIIPLITTPYVARVLGADLVGNYSYHITVATYFVTFTMLGLENYGNRAIAEVKNNIKKLNVVFSEIYSLQIITGFVMIVVYLIYMFSISSDIILSGIFLGNVVAACINVNWALYGLENFKAISLCTVVSKIIGTISVFLFVNTKKDFDLYCIIMVVSTLCTNCLMWFCLLKKVHCVKPELKNVFGHFKKNCLLFLMVISVTMCKTVDKLMLGIFDQSRVQLGYYELSERIINIPVILVASLGTVMMPRISNIISINKDSGKELVFYGAFFSAAIVSSMSFGIMGISDMFVLLYYGEGYEVCKYLYLILLPASIFMAFANVLRTQVLLPFHMDNKILISGYSALIINIGINAILIPILGAVGAAIATVCAEVTSCIIQTFSVRNIVKIRLFIKVFILQMVIGITMFLCIYFWEISNLNIVTNLILKIIMGASIYITLYVVYILVFVKKRGSEEEKSIADFIITSVRKMSKFKS